MTEFLRLATKGRKAEDTAGEMAERIKAMIYEYADRVPLATAIGVLRIVEHEIIADQAG